MIEQNNNREEYVAGILDILSGNTANEPLPTREQVISELQETLSEPYKIYQMFKPQEEDEYVI